jgi:predicted MFS family arabinose efflux permease
MSETLGLLVGSMAGGWLYQRVGVTTPFFFEAACMVVASFVLGRWTLAAAEPPSPVARDARDGRPLRTVLRTPGVRLMSVVSAALIAIQTGLLAFLFPLYLVNRANMRPEMVGFLVSLSVLGRLVALWFGGSVSDRAGRLRVLIPGLFAYAALLGTLTFLTYPVILGLWSLAIGAAAGFVAPLPTVLIGDAVPPSLQAVAIGWLRTVTDTGHILGALVMGALADAQDLSAPFLLGAGLLAVTAWRCHRRASMMLRTSGQRDS